MSVSFLIRPLLVLIIFGSAVLSCTAQQPTAPVNEGDRVMFVEIKDLDDTSYGELTKALKDNPMFQIKQVCIPAGVMMLSIPATNTNTLDENFAQFENIARTKADLDNAHILAEYDENAFLNRCKQFRTGG